MTRFEHFLVLSILTMSSVWQDCQAQSTLNAWNPPAETGWPVSAASSQLAPGAAPTGRLPSVTTDLPPAVPAGTPPVTLPRNSPANSQGNTVGELIGPSNLAAPADSAVFEPEASLTPFDWGVWVSPVDWDGSFEVGINGTEGNAQTFSFRTGGNLKKKIDLWELTTSIIYAKTVADGKETQNNAIFNAGYEYFFPESPWTHYGKMYLEYDEFQAFDLRVVMNAGLGYQVIQGETVKLKGRYGAGVSHEIGSPDERWIPEANFGVDYSHQLSKRQKLSLTADYYPEWADFHNYRIVTTLNWEMLLDEASNLNLKLSVNDRYDSTPNGSKPNYVLYSLLLIWKI